QDAETGERGFVITGRQLYLEPYRNAVEAIPVYLEALRARVEDRPRQMDRVAELEGRVREKLEELQAVVRLVDDGMREEAADLIQSDSGQIVMSDIRTLA